jgi:hypothetical protein
MGNSGANNDFPLVLIKHEGVSEPWSLLSLHIHHALTHRLWSFLHFHRFLRPNPRADHGSLLPDSAFPWYVGCCSSRFCHWAYAIEGFSAKGVNEIYSSACLNDTIQKSCSLGPLNIGMVESRGSDTLVCKPSRTLATLFVHRLSESTRHIQVQFTAYSEGLERGKRTAKKEGQ